MKMNHLLAQHQKFATAGLPENLGDGYLMKQNPVYRTIREAALAAGFSFSTQRDPVYETFPLLHLDSILRTKTIPYSDNVIPLSRLTSAQAALLSWDDIVGNLKRNFVFHEGCHAVVHTLAGKMLPAVQLKGDMDSERAWALRLLLEESCANTVELLGVIFAEDSTHRLFYELNSYILEFESRANIKKLVGAIGMEAVALIMILSYLHANFLRERIEDEDFKQIVHFLGLEKKIADHGKAVRATMKLAFNLSERFRYQTTGFHLKLAGVKTPVEDLFDFPLMAVIARNSRLREFLSAFVKIIDGQR